MSTAGSAASASLGSPGSGFSKKRSSKFFAPPLKHAERKRLVEVQDLFKSSHYLEKGTQERISDSQLSINRDNAFFVVLKVMEELFNLLNTVSEGERPSDFPKREELEQHYAQCFSFVSVLNSTHRLPWADRTSKFAAYVQEELSKKPSDQEGSLSKNVSQTLRDWYLRSKIDLSIDAVQNLRTPDSEVMTLARQLLSALAQAPNLEDDVSAKTKERYAALSVVTADKERQFSTENQNTEVPAPGSDVLDSLVTKMDVRVPEKPAVISDSSLDDLLAETAQEQKTKESEAIKAVLVAQNASPDSSEDESASSSLITYVSENNDLLRFFGAYVNDCVKSGQSPNTDYLKQVLVSIECPFEERELHELVDILNQSVVQRALRLGVDRTVEEEDLATVANLMSNKQIMTCLSAYVDVIIADGKEAEAITAHETVIERIFQSFNVGGFSRTVLLGLTKSLMKERTEVAESSSDSESLHLPELTSLEQLVEYDDLKQSLTAYAEVYRDATEAELERELKSIDLGKILEKYQVRIRYSSLVSLVRKLQESLIAGQTLKEPGMTDGAIKTIDYAGKTFIPHGMLLDHSGNRLGVRCKTSGEGLSCGIHAIGDSIIDGEHKSVNHLEDRARLSALSVESFDVVQAQVQLTDSVRDLKDVMLVMVNGNIERVKEDRQPPYMHPAMATRLGAYIDQDVSIQSKIDSCKEKIRARYREEPECCNTRDLMSRTDSTVDTIENIFSLPSEVLVTDWHSFTTDETLCELIIEYCGLLDQLSEATESLYGDIFSKSSAEELSLFEQHINRSGYPLDSRELAFLFLSQEYQLSAGDSNYSPRELIVFDRLNPRTGQCRQNSYKLSGSSSALAVLHHGFHYERVYQPDHQDMLRVEENISEDKSTFKRLINQDEEKGRVFDSFFENEDLMAILDPYVEKLFTAIEEGDSEAKKDIVGQSFFGLKEDPRFKDVIPQLGTLLGVLVKQRYEARQSSDLSSDSSDPRQVFMDAIEPFVVELAALEEGDDSKDIMGRLIKTIMSNPSLKDHYSTISSCFGTILAEEVALYQLSQIEDDESSVDSLSSDVSADYDVGPLELYPGELTTFVDLDGTDSEIKELPVKNKEGVIVGMRLDTSGKGKGCGFHALEGVVNEDGELECPNYLERKKALSKNLVDVYWSEPTSSVKRADVRYIRKLSQLIVSGHLSHVRNFGDCTWANFSKEYLVILKDHLAKIEDPIRAKIASIIKQIKQQLTSHQATELLALIEDGSGKDKELFQFISQLDPVIQVKIVDLVQRHALQQEALKTSEEVLCQRVFFREEGSMSLFEKNLNQDMRATFTRELVAVFMAKQYSMSSEPEAFVFFQKTRNGLRKVTYTFPSVPKPKNRFSIYLGDFHFQRMKLAVA